MTARVEPLVSVWRRRAATIPLTLALAALAAVTAPAWLAAGLAVDLASGSARLLPRTRALLFFALYLACEAGGIAGATLAWLVTLGGRLGGLGRFLGLNAALQRWWSGALYHGSLRLFSMSVSTEGAESPFRGPLLLFVRHASTADTVLAAALVANPGRLLLRYVLKRELLRDPCLDLVGRRLPNAFVDREGPGREAEVAALATLASGLDPGSGVLIFPEGTRFGEAKLHASVGKLREMGRDDLATIAGTFRNVLPPRLGGPLAVLEAAKGVDVLFVEHTGFEGAASFREFWSGALVGKRLHVRFRRVAGASIPAAGRDVWLFERWAEMDRWISAVRA